MHQSSVRAVFIGLGIFLGLLIASIISDNPVTVKTFFPPVVGGPGWGSGCLFCQ